MKSTVSLMLIAALFVSAPDAAAQRQIDPRAGPITRAMAREMNRLIAASPATQAVQTAPVSEADRWALTQTSDQAPQPMPERPSWAARHPVFLGALIGGGAGGVFGHANRNFSAFVAIPGAIEGAFVGLIVSAVQNANRRYAGSNTPDIVAVRRIVAAVGVGGGIVVTRGNGQSMTGQVHAIGQSDFAIVPDGETTSVPIAYGDVSAIRAKGLSGGAKLGLAAGVAFNVVILWGITSLQDAALVRIGPH